MDIIGIMKTWATMSVRKMIVTGAIVLIILSGLLYQQVGDRIEFITPLKTTNTVLSQTLHNRSIDYVGVFKYDYQIPFTVSEINNACTSRTNEICFKSKDYFLHQDLSRAKFHMQNLCEIHKFPTGDVNYNMKVIGTCPIIIDHRLMGYVISMSVLNTDGDDMIQYLRSTASIITLKME